MEMIFAPNRVVEMNDVRLCFRNFRGLGDKYNKEGDRNFAIVIPDMSIAEDLQNDTNRYGVGWNVKIKPPREDGDDAFIFLPVKVKFNDKGPKVYLQSGHNRVELNEDTIGMLDEMDILSVDLDIRPYDDELNGRPFRSAYLKSMLVTQNLDRFAVRFAEEEHPEE